MKVQDIYDDVCNALLEPNGLVLGMVTEDDFLRFYGEVYQDFLQGAGIIKKLANVVTVSGTSIYEKPEYAMEAEEAAYDRNYLHREDAFTLDALSASWKNQSGPPRRWHEDRLEVRHFEIQPVPARSGYSVTMAASLYGTISAKSLPVDFDVSVSAPLYGVIGGFSGPIYLEAGAWGLGTIADLVPDSLNVTLTATVKPLGIAWTLNDFIEAIPNSFAIYLKWGVLQTIFSMDGETKDEQRAAYCSARFQEGINLSQAISQAVLELEEV